MSQFHLFPPLPLRDTSRSPLREKLVTWGAQRHSGEGPLMVLSQQECTRGSQKRRLEACTDAHCLPLSVTTQAAPLPSLDLCPHMTRWDSMTSATSSCVTV